MNATSNVGWMIRRRPFLSAKNPHKYDEQIIPKNATEPKMPFSLVVRRRSH